MVTFRSFNRPYTPERRPESTTGESTTVSKRSASKTGRRIYPQVVIPPISSCPAFTEWPLSSISGGWAFTTGNQLLATRLLPRRVRVPVQSASLAGEGHAVLPITTTGSRDCACDLSGDCRLSTRPQHVVVGGAKWISHKELQYSIDRHRLAARRRATGAIPEPSGRTMRTIPNHHAHRHRGARPCSCSRWLVQRTARRCW